MKVLLLMLMAFSVFAKDLEVTNARVRFFPPSVTTTGAFMDIKNTTNKEIKIVKAESKVAQVTELHDHIMIDGMMRMREVKHIEVPAKGMTQLKPGSYHVMLIDLVKPLKLGQKVEIKLTLDNGKSLKVYPTVQKIQMMKMHKHKHQHKHQHGH